MASETESNKRLAEVKQENKETGGRMTSVGKAREPVINIRGEKVGLGPLVSEDIPVYELWMNDLDTLRRMGFPIKPRTTEQTAASLEKWTGNEGRVWFAVYELSSGLPVGIAGISHIDQVNRTAEFNISIAERAARGKGYGTEVTRLVLDYAFVGLGLHSVYLFTSERNIAGQRAYAKAGFKEIGRRREGLMEGGRMLDAVYMDCLASEFESPVLAREFED